MVPELPGLRADHPLWRIWHGSSGHLYATRRRMSVLLPGASVTVDSATPDGLRQAIADAESDATKAVSFWERRGYGR